MTQQQMRRRPMVHGEYVGATQELANVLPCDCRLENNSTLFVEGKGVGRCK